MTTFWEILRDVGSNALFVVTVIIFTTYLTLMVYSAISLRKYLRKNSYVDYNSIITSPLAPSVSVIVPAYNESVTITDNIRTLLSLYYNNLEIVVVNDGSSDDTMEKIIGAYELEKVNYFFDYRLPCERIRGVYKSRNRSFKKLVVIDKRNGGKADALNAGLNVVNNELVVTVDADSIVEQDALLKLVKPFLEETDTQVIAAGGVIRIANSCEIRGGRIRKVRLPEKWLPRAQVMEYTRSFLIGRIAWSELNGLLLISGALGIFNREIVIRAGGYSTSTVGEDMELVVRIRRYMAERKARYKVVYIPDPLCWTEVPADLKNLGRQRSRWARGTLETLWTHRRLFFNPKYGKLGLLGYPYWFFFEWLAPILEFVGIIVFIVLAIIGKLNVPFFLLLLGFVYFFAVSVSIWSVLFEEISFHKYEKRRDVLKLMLTAFLEPLFYHPVAMLMNVKGNIDKIFRKSTWGRQERAGFISKNEGIQKKRRILQKKAFASVKESVAPSPAAQSGSAAISSDTGRKSGRSPFRQKQRNWILPAGAISLAAAVAVFFLFRNGLSGERNGNDVPAVVHTEYAGIIDGGKSATVAEDVTGAEEATGTAAASEDAVADMEEEMVAGQGARMAPDTRAMQDVQVMQDAQDMQDVMTTGSYHIIVGSFRNRANADRMAESFREKGYDTMILVTENQFHRVAVASFFSLVEALHYTGEMKQDADLAHSWILHWQAE